MFRKLPRKDKKERQSRPQKSSGGNVVVSSQPFHKGNPPLSAKRTIEAPCGQQIKPGKRALASHIKGCSNC